MTVNTPAPQQNQQKAASPSNAQSQAVTYSAQPDRTGVTFTGRGQPMDLDQACLKCGAKKKDKGTCGGRWHVPNWPVQTRQVEATAGEAKPAQLTAEDDFLTLVRRFTEANPEQFKKAGFGFSTA